MVIHFPLTSKLYKENLNTWIENRIKWQFSFCAKQFGSHVGSFFPICIFHELRKDSLLMISTIAQHFVLGPFIGLERIKNTDIQVSNSAKIPTCEWKTMEVNKILEILKKQFPFPTIQI